MKKDVYISIKGSQDYGNDADAMEITTAGKFYDKDGKYYLSYTEGDLSGMEKCQTTLKIAPDGIVTMMRHGHTNTHMISRKANATSDTTKHRTEISQSALRQTMLTYRLTKTAEKLILIT